MAAVKTINLGSGKLYVSPMTADSDFDFDTLCVEANQIGWISGGAEITYELETYEVKDDLNVVRKKFQTSTSASLKSGILTWNVETFKNMLGNVTYTDDTSSKKRVLKLGTVGAQEMDAFAVAFVHTRKDGTTIRVGMFATNDAGLSLTFSPEEETTVDAEFTSIGCDDNGTVLIIEETYTA